LRPTKSLIRSASPSLYASSCHCRLRIGETDAPSKQKPALTKRLAKYPGKCGWAQCDSRGLHNQSHAFRTFWMPYEGIPICGNKHAAPAWPQYAACLAKNAIHVGDVLGDLSACNDIESGIGLAYMGRADAVGLDELRRSGLVGVYHCVVSLLLTRHCIGYES
jgi:hypothetical protein